MILRTEPPSTPTGVAGASPTRAAPSLAWAASPTAAAYRVYRGSVLAGETTEAAFTDAAQPDGTIQYAVEAIDDVGNRSARSAGVAIVVDTTAPAVPTGTAAPQLARWDPAISWQGPGDAVAYRVLRDGEPIGTTATSPLVDAGAPDGAHVWRVVAIDLAGNESAPSAAATGAVDSTPPAAPVGLDAPAASAGPPELAWTPVADAAAYRIYRGAEAGHGRRRGLRRRGRARRGHLRLPRDGPRRRRQRERAERRGRGRRRHDRPGRAGRARRALADERLPHAELGGRARRHDLRAPARRRCRARRP